VLRNRWLLDLITVVHRVIYLSSGGIMGGTIFWIKILLLFHVGRKTGQIRTTPLLYIEDGDRWIVTASNAGDDQHPAWWYNLQNCPDVRIQVGRHRIDVTWRQAGPEECDVLWPKLAAAYPYCAEYQRGTEREIPVLILERATEIQLLHEPLEGYPRSASGSPARASSAS
jgi:deazaflavin-dependent oxidoreductase (nitroreductase family)